MLSKCRYDEAKGSKANTFCETRPRESKPRTKNVCGSTRQSAYLELYRLKEGNHILDCKSKGNVPQ